jgi:hypothetical protein
MRLLLVLILLAFFAACLAAMYWGWRNRARRQSALLPPFPPPPENLGDPVLPTTTGVYVGSTTTVSWQDRIAVGGVGLRAAATLRLHPEGLLIDRVGASPLWIPAAAILGARTDRALAGKIVAHGGLLVVRWQHGDQPVDSGFRGDDPAVYQTWIDRLGTVATGSVTA